MSRWGQCLPKSLIGFINRKSLVIRLVCQKKNLATGVSGANSYTHRTHSCGELTGGHVGQEVTLCGWLQYQRMGKFITLRDSFGATQVVLSDYKDENFRRALEKLPYESVIEVKGEVQPRPSGHENTEMDTGSIEVKAKDFKILNLCQKNLPFQIHDFHQVKESLRMQYRYLDLRNTEMQRNLRMRSEFVMKTRKFLCDMHGFIDVETPSLFRKTPGGAREFVVPTHMPGKYYALPQSPQQFKQLLMVGGLDRYMQIARCYRDETAKPDRQPEFTQVDLEMSFITKEDIQRLTEDMLVHCWPGDREPPRLPLPRMTYAEALKQYGTDKPDTRFDMKLCDLSHMLVGIRDPKLFKLADAVAHFPTQSVQGINFTHAMKHLSNKDIKELNTLAKDFIVGQREDLWYAIIPVREGNRWHGTLGSHLGDNLQSQINLHLNLHAEDVLLLAAGEHVSACNLLGKLRVEVANKVEANGHRVRGDRDRMNMLWVTDFPLFLPREDGAEGCESAHHPFTAPHADDIELVYKQPEGARSQHYDLVLNGAEIGGGSIRIHNSSLQRYIIGRVLKEDTAPLEHLIESLDFGCPPHGGLALGLDRLLAILCDASSIRDVIAFPKSGEGRDLMAGAPAEIGEEDCQYYHIPHDGQSESSN